VSGKHIRRRLNMKKIGRTPGPLFVLVSAWRKHPRPSLLCLAGWQASKEMLTCSKLLDDIFVYGVAEILHRTSPSSKDNRGGVVGRLTSRFRVTTICQQGIMQYQQLKHILTRSNLSHMTSRSSSTLSHIWEEMGTEFGIYGVAC